MTCFSQGTLLVGYLNFLSNMSKLCRAILLITYDISDLTVLHGRTLANLTNVLIRLGFRKSEGSSRTLMSRKCGQRTFWTRLLRRCGAVDGTNVWFLLHLHIVFVYLGEARAGISNKTSCYDPLIQLMPSLAPPTFIHYVHLST